MISEIICVKQPKYVHVELFEYQLHAIHMLEEYEKTKKIITPTVEIDTDVVFFSDKVGAGKTITVIGLIARDKMKVKNYEITKYISCDSISMKQKYSFKDKYINATFILMSPSLICQWEKELDKTDLPYYSISKKTHIEQFDLNDIKEDYDVVLCSATMFKDFFSYYGEYMWKRFVIDEVDSIKIPSMPRIYSNTTILITATPSYVNKVKGRNNWIHSLFYKRMYGDVNIEYKYLVIKNDDEYVDTFITLPPPNIIVHKCLPSVMTSLMVGLIKPTIMDLISAGDIQGAIKELGGENADENIMSLVTKNINKEVNECKDEIRRNKENRKYWEAKLDELNKKINILKERFENILHEECAICMDKKESPVMITCCQNIACGKCLLNWVSEHDTCPFCRKNKADSKLIYLKEKSKDVEEDEEKEEKIKEKKNTIVSKSETVINIIKSNKKSKVLLFSMCDKTFENIKEQFDKANIKYKTYAGSKACRDKYINDFKDGSIQVLFINSRVNGSGLNLQCATDIILYHSMYEEIERQCIGRGQRQGRKTVLTVHKFESD